jgi:hypothetical protein
MPGATIADVYVRLGEPSAVDGRKFRWVAGAADSGYVVAEIDNGHLESIACPDGERR